MRFTRSDCGRWRDSSARWTRVLRKLGRSNGTVKERVEQLKKDLSYPLTEDGRKQIMADIDGMIREAERRSALQFDMRPEEAGDRAAVSALPRGECRGVVHVTATRRIAARDLSDAAAARSHDEVRAAHARASRDRSRPSFSDWPDGRRSVAAEVQAGAVCSAASRRSPKGGRSMRSGWPPSRAGMPDDPEGLLGQMEAELFRARRLVVDTGLHAKRWTREQAIDYGIDAERSRAIRR